MRLTSKALGSWGIFEVEGSVDSIHTRVFVDSLSSYLNQGQKNCILDLSKAPFLSIGAIRYINQAAQYLEASGGKFALLGASDRVKRHIDIFVSWKKIKEISSLWELIPLQMASKLAEAVTIVISEPPLIIAGDSDTAVSES